MDTTLHRIDPARNAFRFYRLALWPDLFGGVGFAREWRRLEQPGKLRLNIFETDRLVGDERITNRGLSKAVRQTPD